MKLILAGTFENVDKRVINKEVSKVAASEIVVGDLVSSDDVREWAERCGSTTKVFRLDFDGDRFAAMQLMNFRMVQYSDGVIIFKGNKSHHKALLRECIQQSKRVIDLREK